MAETETDIDRAEDRLGALFAAARREAQDLPPGLQSRILADATRIGAAYGDARSRVSPGDRLRRIRDMLGGWPAMAGLATACAAGVWIGLAPPSFLPDPVDLVLGDQSVLDQIDSDPFATLPEDDA